MIYVVNSQLFGNHILLDGSLLWHIYRDDLAFVGNHGKFADQRETWQSILHY
jgi:hypothetical protein